jgi:hypothetical protein
MMRRFVERSLLISLAAVASTSALGAQTPQDAQTSPSQVVPPLQRPAEPPPEPPAHALPDWLRVGLEHRGRLEGPRGIGFHEGRDDAYWLNRFRIDVRMKPAERLLFHVQAQDAQVFGRNVKPDAPPFQDTLDLRIAFAEIGRIGGAPVSVRLGRQELAFGEQRLVGHVSWTNTARTFDAARVTVTGKGVRVDGFASSLVAVHDRQFNRSRQGEDLHGVYAAIGTLLPRTVVEPYVFMKTADGVLSERGERASLRSATIGARAAGTLPARFDYNTDVAIQRGSLETDMIRAWASHVAVGRLLVPKRAMRVFGEYNYATGDADPHDGVRGTFDQLYPTPHDKYGLADQVGWRNIHHVRAGLELKPHRQLSVASGYHSWWRASTADAMYAAGGAALVRALTGVMASHIGQELDVQGTWVASPRVQLHGGYAHIFPGAFLREATPGRRYSAPYVMVTSTILKGDR